MIINKDNYHDAQSYYKGTWSKFKESGDELWHIDDVHSDSILATNTKGEQGKIEFYGGDYQLDFAIPKRATYQLDDHAIHLSRIPARMWKKGIHHKNTRFSMLTHDGYWIDVEFNKAWIEGFINKPSYVSFELAQEIFANGDEYASLALNPRMAITKMGKIFLDHIPIAHFYHAEQSLIAKKIFKLELAKLIPSFDTLTVKLVR